MSNKYVDFVSDKYFEKCVKYVCDAYANFFVNIDKDKLQSNGIDPIKMTFDIRKIDGSFNSWLIREKLRQDDKTAGMAIGQFHQMLLGGVDGWKDLMTGDGTHLDLQKEDNTIWMELKNKENTVNSASQHKMRERLEDVSETHPNCKCYWAYVVALNGKSENKIWWPYTNAKEKNENIRKLSGDKIYDVVTGSSGNLKKTLDALQKVIPIVCADSKKIKNEDIKQINTWFKDAFEK